MEDIRRQDQLLLRRELLSPSRLMLLGIAGLFLGILYRVGFANPAYLLIAAAMAGLLYFYDSREHARRRKWHNPRFRALHEGCQDRLARFEEVLKRLRKDQIADLREMPKTMRSVSESLYVALRRADIIAHEVLQSERGMQDKPPTWVAGATDPQSMELYRLADRNIAEYRQQFAGVMAGVERTEAQSAVFMTTLDSLRMKMIGYRLVGRRPEMGSQDFLEALAEARLQLQSIDQALEELDLGHYPRNIAAVPPRIPTDDDITNRLNS